MNALRNRHRSSRPARPVIDDPEAALMLRVQRDEPGAFAEMVENLRPRIFGRFIRSLHDRQEAEDLTQEVFLRIYRSRKRYEPRAKFTTWLFHITQNVARNAIRRRRRHAWLRYGALENDQDEGLQRCLGRPACLPSERLERGELAKLVRGAVAELLGRQRRALEMHHFQDRSYAEIAHLLDLTPEATKSLIYRARLHLRDGLQAALDR
jgi:RNA polymerase sigma-70 factor (ECF subfamily)